jgi:6-phosphofructokinase 1
MVALNPPTVDVVPLSAAISRQKTVELDGDTMHTARELGICFGDRAV